MNQPVELAPGLAATQPGQPAWGRGPSARYEALAAPFRPVFARIAEGAVERERTRTLPYAEIAMLKAARFGAVRLPVAEGGLGASLAETAALLIELAEADSNVAQILRLHVGVVENFITSTDGAFRDRWLPQVAAGAIWGGAFTERGAAKAGTFATRLAPEGTDWLLDGEKFYSTGSLFADWLDIMGIGPGETWLMATVEAGAAGVEQIDDWDGFGQQMTGSGTSIFRGVRLPADQVRPVEGRFRHEAGLYQMVHLATLTGIARAAARDVAGLVARRTRTFSHANGRVSRQDPQVLQVVGQVHAAAYAAGAITRSVAEALDHACAAARSGEEAVIEAANVAAEIEAAQGQSVVCRLVLDATTVLFDALGASALAKGIALDRHWRNARTIANHNPVIYKERVVGDHAVNGTAPPFLWFPGEG